MNDKIIKKTFIIGEEWIYYKINCGVKTADEILVTIVKPLSEELSKKQLIDKWFFIRYSDPEPHLRVRFHILKLDEISIIIHKMKRLIEPYINSQQVWDIQLATYNRELERYGKGTIEIAESFFFYDSINMINIIETTEDDALRFLSVFKWIDYLISSFNFETKEQLLFLDTMATQFKEEFNANKTTTKELNLKYKNLENQLTVNNTKTPKNLESITLKLLNFKSLEVSLSNLLASYIHMSINRCFRSKQRLYEMMVYDFLNKKYKTKFARYGKF